MGYSMGDAIVSIYSKVGLLDKKKKKKLITWHELIIQIGSGRMNKCVIFFNYVKLTQSNQTDNNIFLYC